MIKRMASTLAIIILIIISFYFFFNNSNDREHLDNSIYLIQENKAEGYAALLEIYNNTKYTDSIRYNAFAFATLHSTVGFFDTGGISLEDLNVYFFNQVAFGPLLKINNVPKNYEEVVLHIVKALETALSYEEFLSEDVYFSLLTYYLRYSPDIILKTFPENDKIFTDTQKQDFITFAESYIINTQDIVYYLIKNMDDKNISFYNQTLLFLNIFRVFYTISYLSVYETFNDVQFDSDLELQELYILALNSYLETINEEDTITIEENIKKVLSVESLLPFLCFYTNKHYYRNNNTYAFSENDNIFVESYLRQYIYNIQSSGRYLGIRERSLDKKALWCYKAHQYLGNTFPKYKDFLIKIVGPFINNTPAWTNNDFK